MGKVSGVEVVSIHISTENMKDGEAKRSSSKRESKMKKIPLGLIFREEWFWGYLVSQHNEM